MTDPSKQVKLGFVSGLVQRDKSTAFERILFRATRGNVFLKQAAVEEPIRDPSSGEKVNNCDYFCLLSDKVLIPFVLNNHLSLIYISVIFVPCFYCRGASPFCNYQFYDSFYL